jgi:hypothetical protein
VAAMMQRYAVALDDVLAAQARRYDSDQA